MITLVHLNTAKEWMDTEPPAARTHMMDPPIHTNTTNRILDSTFLRHQSISCSVKFPHFTLTHSLPPSRPHLLFQLSLRVVSDTKKAFVNR